VPDIGAAEVFAGCACLLGYALGRYHGEQQAYERVKVAIKELLRDLIDREQS
jgi:hypothetical protein